MRCMSRNCFSSRLTSWTCTPAPPGDAAAARAVNDGGYPPLTQGHGIDHGDLAAHLHIGLLGSHPLACQRLTCQLGGELAHDRAHTTHTPHLLQL